MTSNDPKLLLRNVAGSHPNIEITSIEPFFLGRTRESCIEDVLVSRNHINMVADFGKQHIKLKVLGLNPSSLNGNVLERNKEYTIMEGDVIEVLHTKYAYEVCFVDEKPDDNNKENGPIDEKEDGRGIKRKLSFPDEQNKPKKRKWKADIFLDAKLPFPDDPQWQSYNRNQLVVFTPVGLKGASKIAAYDMDGTLIATKSGRVFPKDVDDWKIAFPTITNCLKEKVADEYKIVVFTNQAGISKGKTKLGDFKKKIEKIAEALKVPMQVFIATGDSFFRKPLTGMWQALCMFHNDNVELDLVHSYYVGDAAGRPENKSMKKKKDHSSVDRLLALNLGIPFLTPEEQFLKAKAQKWNEPVFNPMSFCQEAEQNLDLQKLKLKLDGTKPEVILMVGGPGSGKSYFAQSITSYGYEIVSRDILGSWQKCVDRVNDCIEAGRKVIVDNTNGTKDERGRYISAAKKHKVPCRCFHMATSDKHAEHNIAFRELTDPTHTKINSIVLNGQRKRYESPDLQEGFKDIFEIDFVPKFENESDRLLYSMYLLSS